MMGYNIGTMFWYKAIFMAELIVAETLLAYRFRFRSLFWLRLLGAVMVCFGTAFALPVAEDNILWGLITYVLLFSVTVLVQWFCFRERLVTILFYAAAAYTLQHIAHELFSLCAVTMNFNVGGDGSGNALGSFLIYSNSSEAVNVNPFTMMVYFFVYGVTYFIGYYTIKRRVRDDYAIGGANIKMLLLAGVILFFDIAVSSFITYYSAKEYSKIYLALLHAFNIACCIFALIFQFFIDKQGRLESELKFIERLWEEKRKQYDISKENIELVNQKCHDLKHQIRKIGKKSLNPQAVGEIEDIVSIYDSSVQTGNESLDIILTEKSLICSRNGIKLCCMIDGKSLAFISSVDLYALFGNILDNAIEAVTPLAKPDKIISLSVKIKNKFVVVNTYNKCETLPEFADGLPKTTKSDSSIHGYGMKSVRMICDKYGGEFSVTVKDDLFTLNMLFPIKDGEQ